MNIWLVCAGALGVFTFLVHLIGGQIDPVRPFLKSNLEDVPKATLMACWHMVTVVLLITSLAMLYVGWESLSTYYTAVLIVSWTYVTFALVFLAVGWYFFQLKTFIKLPQWTLLLPIGVLGIFGTV